MGIRQHMAALEKRQLVERNREEKQPRGRPVHLWTLTAAGHRRFDDSHAGLAVDLIAVIRESLGEDRLNELADATARRYFEHYQTLLDQAEQTLEQQLHCLARLRSEDGYMAEVRLLPDGAWLLIENHCPVRAAAAACRQLCHCELAMFQQLLGEQVSIQRTDYLLDGARRCAYKVTPATRRSQIAGRKRT